MGGWNHLPGVSGHWCDSGSSSSSGDPLGISSMTGGKSSRRVREVEAAAGVSSPTSMTESGRAAPEETARGKTLSGSCSVGGR